MRNKRCQAHKGNDFFQAVHGTFLITKHDDAIAPHRVQDRVMFIFPNGNDKFPHPDTRSTSMKVRTSVKAGGGGNFGG